MPNDKSFSVAAKAIAEETMLAMAADQQGHAVSFIGQTTVGKTMLARIILNFWNLRVSPRRYSRPDLTSFHSGCFISWPSHDWKELETERAAPCMVIDEVGRGARDQSRLIELISYRENRRLWTIITSNLIFDEIATWDRALAERLRRNGSRCLEAPACVRPFTVRRPETL